MLNINFSRIARFILLGALLLTLTGCLYWMRAFQTYQQLDEFDKYFSVAAADDFTLGFKKPIMFSEDFVSLSGLQPSSTHPDGVGKRWRYWFRKVDGKNKVIQPEVKFYFDLDFNRYDKLTAWTFSPLFLQIAPPKFLEVSLRSLAGAEINKETKQLKAKSDHLQKIAADLPKKSKVIKELGKPNEIVAKGKDQEVYLYHFMLDSMGIEKGYEDRALSIVKLTFDKQTDELIKMSGRFAGLKITISYRKYIEDSQDS